MAYDFDLRELAPQPTVVMRADVPSAELPAAIGRVLPAVWGYLESRGIMPAGPPFVRYVSFDDQRTSFEGGFSVGAGVSGEGEVESSSLPGGYLAVTTHHGPYDRLIDAYQAMERWIAAEGWRANGPVWELYWTDPGAEPDPAKWRTEIFQPVRRPDAPET
jgi:effector-binding domain-containing protein